MRTPLSGLVLVFGSNEAGRHGRGAAKMAKDHFGAVYGRGVAHYGQSYAIPTKDRDLQALPLDKVARYVSDFISYAKDNQHIKFLVTRVGCGLAGYQDKDIAPLFAGTPSNCLLPVAWGGSKLQLHNDLGVSRENMGYLSQDFHGQENADNSQHMSKNLVITRKPQ